MAIPGNGLQKTHLPGNILDPDRGRSGNYPLQGKRHPYFRENRKGGYPWMEGSWIREPEK
jgi:hypothetical protein